MLASDVAMATQWAAFYRGRGFQPLPSRTDDKRPMCTFAEWWDTPAPANLFEQYRTTNIQVMTGRAWRLLVIDLDGAEARVRWQELAAGRAVPTWITHSGGDGLHLWYRLPADYGRPLPKVFLWRGEQGHSGIERLCDRSLVMAPPSIHPKTGQRYRFLSRASSPARLPLPADCPAWVLRLAPPERPGRARPPRLTQPVGNIPSLVRSWGVRLAGNPGRTGWIPCHAIDREDAHPSAAIHAETGYYVDHGSGQRMGLVDLSLRLGIYRDVREAMQQLRAS